MLTVVVAEEEVEEEVELVVELAKLPFNVESSSTSEKISSSPLERPPEC